MDVTQLALELVRLEKAYPSTSSYEEKKTEKDAASLFVVYHKQIKDALGKI